MRPLLLNYIRASVSRQTHRRPIGIGTEKPLARNVRLADFSPRCMVGRAIDLSLGLIGATVVDSGTIPLSLNPLSPKRRVFSRSILMILVVLISAAAQDPATPVSNADVPV